MKKREAAIFGAGIMAGAFVAAAIGCISLRGPETIVREPEKPGESTMTYTPPRDPNLSVEFIREVGPMLRTMMGPEIHKVTNEVYAAVGYAFGTITMIITNDSLVIVDTGVSVEAAQKVLAEFRKITDKPISHIIYTHSHQDHTLGSSVFYSQGVEVIATNEFIDYRYFQEDLLGGFYSRARAIQFGFIEPDYAFKLPVSGGPTMFMKREWPEVVPPTRTFDHELSIEVGGKQFVIFAAPGETPCQLAVWMPQDRLLMAGDLYYHSFPNLSSPLLESRPVRDWIKSLEKYIELEPDYLVLGHTDPVAGKDVIKERLTNYRKAIKYVHDETVRCINEGKDVNEAVREVKLPPELAELPYLQEYYGKVDWSVRGIYRGYTGWYKGDGTGLNPLPARFRARELVALAGGADKILTRAVELQKRGEHQLCAELCDVVIAANPDDRMAHIIKAESMHALAYSANNLNSFLCYRSAYSIHMKAADRKPGHAGRTEKSVTGD